MSIPAIGPLTTGTVFRFEPIVSVGGATVKGSCTKNGAVWNVSGYTVDLLLTQIDGTTGTVVVVNAVITDAANGKCYADWQTGAVGTWSACWRINDGSANGVKILPVQFQVVPAP